MCCFSLGDLGARHQKYIVKMLLLVGKANVGADKRANRLLRKGSGEVPCSACSLQQRKKVAPGTTSQSQNDFS